VEKTAFGGYTVQEHITEGSTLPHPTLVLVSTGTEVALALQVAKNLFEASAAAGTR
jgi:transketolase